MTASGEAGARQAIVDACLKMTRDGINQGTAGNISVRGDGGLLIRPSGIPYDEMTAGDIVFMDMDGGYKHHLAASSEWRMHRDILQTRGEVNAIVHAHSVYATAFAICGMEIPAAHYMIAVAGGPTIRCAPYETYGTAALSKVVLDALGGRTCALMANHGMIAIGGDLREAMWIAVELETLCKQYALALQIGTPRVLAAREIEKTIEKFKDYGLRRKPRAA